MATKIKGIDVSRWQGNNFNFAKAVKEGIEFVIVKGGGGDDGLYVDSMFSRNYTEAKKQGLPVGCYWFSKALTVSEAEKEADYFYANCLKGRQFELPVYIDVENKSQLALGKRLLTDIIKAWCERIKAKGYLVGIYSSKSFFGSYMYDKELFGYEHWVAQWASQCTYTPTSCLGMWQFGGETNYICSNKVAGVVCDQNYMLVDYPAKIKAEGLNGFAKTQTATKPTAPAKPATSTAAKNSIKVGDTVKLNKGAKTYDGKGLASFVYNRNHTVKEIAGQRAVIAYNGITVAAVKVSDLTLVSSASKPTSTTKAPAKAPAKPTATIKKGSTVKLKKGAKTYDGKNLASFVYNRNHKVKEISGQRVVITYAGIVVAAVKLSDLTLIS